MLQKLRDQTESFGFKLLAGVIIFVLAIFGFGAFNLFLNPDPEIASVNGESITQNDLTSAAERERRRIAMQFGEQFDPSMLDSVRLQSMVLDQLISRALLQDAADELDIGVSQKRIDESVTGNPSFQVDGQFQADVYRRAVEGMLYTPKAFLEEMGELLALEQLQNGVTQTALLTDWELRQNARLLNQRRDLAYLPFTIEGFSSSVEVSEDEVALRYEENAADYETEETVDVAYVELSAEALINDDSITLSEDEIRGAYEAEATASLMGDRRRSRHILLQVGDDRSAEEAEAELVGLKDRLSTGADFAELAQEFSEDPGSATGGGELGLVGKGVFDPEFERVLWSLQEGEVSDPVRTEFGYHLIELNEIEVAEYPPFEDQRADVELRLRRDQAAGLFIDRLRELDNLAFEQPNSLDGISQELGLAAQNTLGVSRNAGDGIFANVAVRDAVFAGDVIDKGFNTAAVEMTDNRAVVARVMKRHAPEPIPMSEVGDDIRAEIVAERARALAEESHLAALARVRAGESVSVVANDYSLRWEAFSLASRSQPDVPATVLEAAFALARPGDGAKSVGQSTLEAAGNAVITVTRIVDGDLALMAETEIESLRDGLNSRAGNLDFGAFYTTLESAASVSRPE